MNIIQEKETRAYAIKLLAKEGEKIVGRAYIYILWNDLHEEPFALLEDVFVEEDSRGKGYGTQLVHAAIEAAKEEKCYKMVGEARHTKKDVQEWYKKLGFRDHATMFRIDF